MKIVIDTCAWIEHFLGTEKSRKIDDILKEADEVYTPDTVLAEIARKYMRDGFDLATVNKRLAQVIGASFIVSLDANLAVKAGQCYLEMEAKAKKLKRNLPSLFDAIVLTTARSLNASVLTGDQHFRDLPETVWPE